MACEWICDGCGKRVTTARRPLQPAPPVGWTLLLCGKGRMEACSPACAEKVRADVYAEERARKIEREYAVRG